MGSSVLAVAEVVNVLDDAVGLLVEVPECDAGDLVHRVIPVAVSPVILEVAPVCADGERSARSCVAYDRIKAVAVEACC